MGLPDGPPIDDFSDRERASKKLSAQGLDMVNFQAEDNIFDTGASPSKMPTVYREVGVRSKGLLDAQDPKKLPEIEAELVSRYRKFEKDYKSYAYTTIIEHKKILNNNVATQTFTKKGPIAFLPISKKETSVVYSIKGDRKIEIAELIRNFNIRYKIVKINKINCFKLQSSNLRSYHHKNILAFGDLLHRIHPLAGQGFNMSIRDIKSLIKIIDFKISLGLNLDSSICEEFENKSKHKNYIFSSGIDL